MYPMVLESLKACAFMILSMLADHPYCDVTMQHGDCTRRFDTNTFSTFLSKISLVMLTRFLPSYSFNYCTQYSSMGSVMYSTSKPRLTTLSTNTEFCTCSFDSPVM